MKLHGKYGDAIVYTDDVEQEAISQIYNLLNQPMAEGANIRIMPDVHAGSGCVIGYTAKLTDKIVPNLIGVDIGCAVTAWKLGKRSDVGEKFDKLDNRIKQSIPSGKDVHSGSPNFSEFERVLKHFSKMSFGDFHEKITEICRRTGQNEKRVWQSIGTLGGGNHFIEIDRDDGDNLWLLIHSGSRNFGLKVALHHQSEAENQTLCMSKEDYDKKVEEIKKTKKGKSIEVAIKKLRAQASVRKHKRNGLEYLEGSKAEDYYKDMKIAQIYAQLNRRVMGNIILNNFYKMSYFEPVESVHNYINFEDGIVRKGAISAHLDEQVIIPLNMADGCIFGVGLGDSEWNFSAPHGSGRKMSRTKAKASIRLEDFQKKMKNVWSSTVNKSTLDEAPQAYKNSDTIIELLKDTVDIKTRMMPVYNFKSSE